MFKQDEAPYRNSKTVESLLMVYLSYVPMCHDLFCIATAYSPRTIPYI
jgi:hypothetical protein